MVGIDRARLGGVPQEVHQPPKTPLAAIRGRRVWRGAAVGQMRDFGTIRGLSHENFTRLCPAYF